MKITDVKLYPVGTRRETGGISPHIIVTVATDEGPVGVGEMSDLAHNPAMPDVDYLEYTLNKRLSGADPFDPERIDPIVDEFQAPLGAGIDTAVHDLRGKILGVPSTTSTAAHIATVTRSVTPSSARWTCRSST